MIRNQSLFRAVMALGVSLLFAAPAAASDLCVGADARCQTIPASVAAADASDAIRVETERIYLSGHGCDDAVDWEFEIDKGARAGEKATIPVPGCWESHGFGVLQYGNYLKGPDKKYRTIEPACCTGVYRHRFAAPEGCDGRHVDLVFQAVFTDCEVSLNGESLGSHQGGFYPFQFDVTGKLRAENELEVTVKSESADESVNFAERRGDYWNFGGIWRPVYLEVKPMYHIRRVAVDAKADGTLDAVVYVSDGTQQEIHEKWDRPRLWTAETPNLYDKAFEIRNAAGRVVHRVVKKIGFRTVEARRGDCLRINGRRVTIKGVNRHSFRPDSGRTLSYARNREDVEIIKSMNMNAVRSSHYPPDADFLDLCDELGLYVVDELCGWQQAIGTKPGTPLVEAFVTRDQAHPSIIWWANGNEDGFNFELDGLYHVFDIQKRPVIHPWAEFGAFHTKHYRDYEQTKEFLAGDWIFMPTEFQHGLYDGGHAAGLGELWALMMSSPRTAGGFLWDLRDQGVLRPDGTHDCHGTNGPDGIIGPNGEKGGSFDAIREIWSPVGIELAADGRSVVFTNRYDFTDLTACRFTWESLGFGGDRETVLAGGTFTSVYAEARRCATAALPGAARGGDAVRVTVTGPRGETVFAKVFALGRSVSAGSVPAGMTCESVSWQPRLVALKGTESRRHQCFLPVAADFSWTAVTNSDASVEYSWTISTTNAVDALGVSFDLDESQVVSKKWLGKGPYRVWRNRPEGPQLGIWENAYNDGYAGESWNFPQFKGYFADTRWMSFELKDGSTVRFDLLEESPYVGAFSPRDGRDELLFQPPELGVSVLAVCPATGNKFTPPKDVSPSGRSVVPAGPVTGRVRVSRIPPSAPRMKGEPRLSVFASFITRVARQRGVSLRAAAALLYDMGVRGFDIGPDEKILPELAKSKLRPINFYYFPNMFADDNGLKDCLHALDVAQRYGVPRIMVVPTHFTGGGDQAAEFEKLLSGMKLFVAEAKKRGITITVEDFGGNKNAGSYMKYLKRFLDEIPDLKFALDTGNLYYANRGEDILEMMAYAKDRIAHVHLKDQTKEDCRKYATLGLGAVPNERIVKEMAASGYDGWYTLENSVGDTYNDTVRQVSLVKAWLSAAPRGMSAE